MMRSKIRGVLIFLLALAAIVNAGYVKSSEFLVTLYPVKVEVPTTRRPALGTANATRLFHFKVRLQYTGKDTVTLRAGENVFIHKDAGFLQRSIFFATSPALKVCSLRQTVEGMKVRELSHTFKPGEILEEEWTHNGQDLNPAQVGGPPSDGGTCLEKPGSYRLQAVLGAWTDHSDFVYAAGNEQEVILK